MKHSFLMTICLFCFCSIFGQETIPLKDALSLTKCKISEYASSIEYIPLETSDDCLIGDEFSLIVASQDIFVHEFSDQKIYRFDRNGKFLNSIGKKGQGPGEYVSIYSIYVDESTRECFLLDTFSGNVLIYDYNGTYKRKIHVPVAPCRMTKIGNNYVMIQYLLDVSTREMVLVAPDGKLLKEYSRNDGKKYGFSIYIPFLFNSNDVLYYKNHLSEYIYSIDEKLKRKKAYWIDLGKKQINAVEKQYDLEKGSTTKGKVVTSTITMFKDLMFIPYAGEDRFFAVYNTTSKKIFSPGLDNKAGFIDDLTQGPLVAVPYSLYLITSLQKNQLATYINMFEIDIDDYPEGEFKQFLVKHNLDEFSNPVVRLVNLK